MRLKNGPDCHLTYCMNIHPAETAADVLQAIAFYPPRVKSALGAKGPLGLGLRLSRKAADELSVPGTLAVLKKRCADNDLYVFTINGFPYGPFHGPAVKQNVYRPDWRTQDRLDYTCRLIDILAECLPEGCEGSISTVPVSYKSWMITPGDAQKAVENLIGCVHALHLCGRNSGKYIHLAMEPEPDCYLATTDDVIEFYDKVLLPQGCHLLHTTHGIAKTECESLIRRHLGICFDVCHLGVQFENPAHSITKLISSGILISKIQLSAALAITADSLSAPVLRRFDDSVYLHQVKIAGKLQGSGLWNIKYSFSDIPEALKQWPVVQSHDECRVHCHVPLYWDGQPSCGSTNHLMNGDFWATIKKHGIRHLEIETYTFSVLPEEFTSVAVEESIAREYRWVLERL